MPALNKTRRTISTATMPLLTLLLTHAASAAWPQWGGPDRNFTVTRGESTKLWKPDALKQRWSRPLGDGFSGVITDGKALYTMYRADDEHEGVIAISADTGKTLWEHKYTAPYINIDKDRKQDTQFGKGPNSTPLLHEGRIYTVGYTCILHCLDAKTGKPLWSHDLFKEFDASLPMFGYAASPLACGSNIVLPVGGKGRGLMAFDQETGRVAWQACDADASYSSPILTKVEGRDHLVAYLSQTIFGLDPATGKVHWSLEHKNPSNPNSICSPIACPDDMVYFVNFGETAGGRMIRLVSKEGTVSSQEVWRNKKLSGGIADAVRIKDRFYGTNGKGILVSFLLKSGEMDIQERGFPGAKCIAAGDHLIVLDDEGNLMQVAPGDGKLEVVSKHAYLEKPAWTAPTVDGRVLYLRDRKTIMALEPQT
jgi:outer membrane protein assembly factor BamB